MPTEQQIATAALALANGVLPAAMRAYEPSKVPASKPNEFVTVTLVRRAGGSPRAGRYVTSGWSLFFMAASRTSEANARHGLDLIRGAFENNVLTVGDDTSTPVRFDNARPVGPDDKYSSGVNTYSFTL